MRATTRELIGCDNPEGYHLTREQRATCDRRRVAHATGGPLDLNMTEAKRAEEVLKILESGDHGTAITRLVDDLPLFSVAARRADAPAAHPEPEPPKPSPVEEALRAVNPDELSPREALEALYRLKGML